MMWCNTLSRRRGSECSESRTEAGCQFQPASLGDTVLHPLVNHSGTERSTRFSQELILAVVQFIPYCMGLNSMGLVEKVTQHRKCFADHSALGIRVDNRRIHHRMARDSEGDTRCRLNVSHCSRVCLADYVYHGRCSQTDQALSEGIHLHGVRGGLGLLFFTGGHSG